jgi:hypothetical protein
MAQAGPDAINLYYGPVGGPVPPQATGSFGFAFPTLVGNPNLTPEKADTWTAASWFSRRSASGALSRLRLSVDWYDITIKDAIGAQTIGAVQQQCFDPAFNPALSGAGYSAATGAPNAQAVTASQNQFCQLLPRNGTGQLGNVLITYANSGRVHLQGIDAQLDWGIDGRPGHVHAQQRVQLPDRLREARRCTRSSRWSIMSARTGRARTASTRTCSSTVRSPRSAIAGMRSDRRTVAVLSEHAGTRVKSSLLAVRR